MILDKSDGTSRNRWLIYGIAISAFLCALPAVAQQLSGSACADQRCLVLPRPAETGKPMVFDAPFRATDDNATPRGCPAALPCRMEVIGTVQRNGAVELRATAFTW